MFENDSSGVEIPATAGTVSQVPLSESEISEVARVAGLIQPFVASVDRVAVPGAVSIGVSFAVWDAATAIVRAGYVAGEAA